MSNHETLTVWKKSDAIALEIYRVTKSFPRHELFGITSQLRRAALSVPTNIAEGNGRSSSKDQARFIDIALGSLAETDYLISFSARLGYIATDATILRADINEIRKMLCALKRSKLT